MSGGEQQRVAVARNRRPAASHRPIGNRIPETASSSIPLPTTASSKARFGWLLCFRRP